MAKTKIEETKTAAKDLPEILTLDIDQDDVHKSVLLIEEGIEVKQTIGVKPDPKKGKAGSGLLKRYDDIKCELAEIQMIYGLDGLRHNRFFFGSAMQDGRRSFKQELAKQHLVLAFSALVPKKVDVIKLVNECFEKATVQGDGFWVKKIGIIGEEGEDE